MSNQGYTIVQAESSARWTKLSYDLAEDVPAPPGLPAPCVKPRSSIAHGDISNVADITVCNHVGTHVDAPLHYDARGLSLADFDINEFHFTHPALVDIPLLDDQLVRPDHLGPFEESIAACDLLLIRTGFGRHRSIDPERYRLKSPGLSAAAAEHIVRNFPDLRCLAVDTISIATTQAPDEGLRAHRTLLGGGRKFLIIEDLNLDMLSNAPCEVMALPLLIQGIDGAPCTVVAR